MVQLRPHRDSPTGGEHERDDDRYRFQQRCDDAGPLRAKLSIRPL